MTKFLEYITIHHVGGRSGSTPVPELSQFSSDLNWTFYEADEACTEQIRESTREMGKVTVLPYCLGKARGNAILYLNKDPNTSSLLPFNKACNDYYYFWVDPNVGPIDYVYGEAMACMEQQPVKVHPLKELVDNGEVEPPDFLTMDTQGSEYEILEGAGSLLDTQVLAVHTEIEFQPIYQNQRLFGDISTLLAGHGFQFARFTSMHEMSPARGPLGARADGFQVFGDGLFLKSPKHILEEGDANTQYVKLVKLAFIAVSYHLLEFALSCLKTAAGLTGTEEAIALLKKTRYAGFLWEMVASIHDNVLPPTFGEKYDYALSQARFSGEHPDEFNFSRLINNMRREVKRRGGKRLCLLPFGKIGREYWPDAPESGELAPIAFFDNFPRDEPKGPPVQEAKALAADDYVFIISYAYSEAIRKQLIKDQGLMISRIFSVKDLHNDRDFKADDSWLTSTEMTPLEEVFVHYGFKALAMKVSEKRAGAAVTEEPWWWKGW